MRSAGVRRERRDVGGKAVEAKGEEAGEQAVDAAAPAGEAVRGRIAPRL